ncbi:hypothetical protein I8K75_000408 [Salmonella enterica]|nr:hypothetical protein [Salmonella enterica]
MINSKIKWRACAAALTLVASQTGLADPLISRPAQLNIDTTIEYGAPTPTVTWAAGSVTLPADPEGVLGTLTITRGANKYPRLAVVIGDCSHDDGRIHFMSENAEQKENLAYIDADDHAGPGPGGSMDAWSRGKMIIGTTEASVTIPVHLTGDAWGGGRYAACVQVWDVTGDR